MDAHECDVGASAGAGWVTIRLTSFDGYRKTLPFLPLFGNVAPCDLPEMLDSSRVERITNLTFGVMGGKSGKNVARTARVAAR